MFESSPHPTDLRPSQLAAKDVPSSNASSRCLSARFGVRGPLLQFTPQRTAHFPTMKVTPPFAFAQTLSICKESFYSSNDISLYQVIFFRIVVDYKEKRKARVTPTTIQSKSNNHRQAKTRANTKGGEGNNLLSENKQRQPPPKKNARATSMCKGRKGNHRQQTNTSYRNVRDRYNYI